MPSSHSLITLNLSAKPPPSPTAYSTPASLKSAPPGKMSEAHLFVNLAVAHA